MSPTLVTIQVKTRKSHTRPRPRGGRVDGNDTYVTVMPTTQVEERRIVSATRADANKTSREAESGTTSIDGKSQDSDTNHFSGERRLFILI